MLHRIGTSAVIWKAFLLAIAFIVIALHDGVASTYYVRQTVGDDANDGLSPKTAWRSIAKLSQAMKAGDTAYVGPGLYREQVIVFNDGTAENRLIFIADTTGQHTGDPPGVVMIAGADAVDEDRFVPHAAPGVYMLQSASSVAGVVEMDGPQYRYKRARNTTEHLVEKLSELEVVAQLPSCHFYDKSARVLYIHTSDGKPPNTHEIELIHRGNGIVMTGKHHVTVMGFTFRHMGDAGIAFWKRAADVIALNNTSYGSRQGIRVYTATGVLVYGNTLFRNDNSGVYFVGESTNGWAIGNIAYENIKGMRWSSQSVNGLALDNTVFENHEAGIAVENANHTLLRRNTVVNNTKSQLLVLDSAYSSEGNCFEHGTADQFTADFGSGMRYKTLAEYQQGKGQELHSREGGCGPLPVKVDVHKLHAETMAYTERARRTLSGGEGHGGAGTNSYERLALSVEAILNPIDGSVRSECEAQDEVEAGKKHDTWVSFAKVKPQGKQGWEVISSSTRCGSGSFDEASALFGRTLGIPYIVVDVETIPAVHSGGKVDLQTTLHIRKLSAFDEKGQPIYARSEQKRGFDLGTGDDAIVPLLVADPRERDAFNVHELFLQLGARVLGREVAAYGAISVMADVPGIDILLDGGLAGRTLEESPTVLRNVLVGKHEVRARDLSSRAAWQQVSVEKDQTVAVVLKLLNLPSSLTPADLAPIGKNPEGYEEYWRARDGAVVVKIPAGEFLMGSVAGDGEPPERPQRQVFVSEFLIDKTEVTWRQFQKFAEATGASLPPVPLWGTPSDYAVSNVLFAEAKAYCDWVGGRLPTEAEWEKAARGTDGRKYPWGNEWHPDRCNSLEGGPHRPEGVGSFPTCLSPYGLIDMAGGVWEWCADWYADIYPEGPVRDPRGPETGNQRVLRGGSWLNMSTWLRTAYRYQNPLDWRSVHNGLRCVQHVPQ